MSTDTVPSHPHTDQPAMPAEGRAPVAPPAAGYIGALLAVLVIAAGCIALRDAFIAAEWISGPLWVDAAIKWVDGLRFAGWMIAAALGLVLIGGWALYSALRPRRKTAVQLQARSAIWIKTVDLARIATTTADTVPGVLDARARATRRKVVVTVHTTDPANPVIAANTEHTVRATVGDVLAGQPKIIVRARKAA